MNIDHSIWERRGEHWYKRGEPSKNPRLPKVCEGCDTECMMKMPQRFCISACANRTQFSKDVVTFAGGMTGSSTAVGWLAITCASMAAVGRPMSGRATVATRTSASGSTPAVEQVLAGPQLLRPRCVSCHGALDSKHGEEHHCAVLTEDDVREIFAMYQSTIHLGRLDENCWTHQKIARRWASRRPRWARSLVASYGHTWTCLRCATTRPRRWSFPEGGELSADSDLPQARVRPTDSAATDPGRIRARNTVPEPRKARGVPSSARTSSRCM